MVGDTWRGPPVEIMKLGTVGVGSFAGVEYLSVRSPGSPQSQGKWNRILLGRCWDRTERWLTSISAAITWFASTSVSIPVIFLV
jgi:hypothetical protein